MMKKVALVTVWVLLMGGCSAVKQKEEYEKPALYWYKKMIKGVVSGNLEKADNAFTSLESEHISSPLIPEAMLILMQAHMDNEEYLLAQFYLDEYMKRYGSYKNRKLAEFIKIKAAFYGLRSPQRDQKLIDDTLKKAQGYVTKYPDSEMTPMAQTIAVRLAMTRYLLNENIASLYERLDKPKAAAIYRERNKKSFVKQEDIQPPHRGWLAWLFE
ncbi:MAG: outer membrane protein assembly factor BamD [Epsilonproteobacteria bacterium]|nr:outer membrane protein assembly factor BamD [Campylobacterota bacterium]